MTMDRQALLLLLVFAAACDGAERVPTQSSHAVSEAARGSEGGGGWGGGDASEDDAPDLDVAGTTEDIAHGPCPLGAQRACRAVSSAGCLIGLQVCEDGAWSPCRRAPRGGDR